MEKYNLKIRTIIFFFSAIKEMHKGIDSALAVLNNNKLDEEQKFNVLVDYVGQFGLSQDLYIEQMTKSETPEIGGPIQKFDYESFQEENYEILLMNGLIDFSISLN